MEGVLGLVLGVWGRVEGVGGRVGGRDPVQSRSTFACNSQEVKIQTLKIRYFNIGTIYDFKSYTSSIVTNFLLSIFNNREDWADACSTKKFK